MLPNIHDRGAQFLLDSGCIGGLFSRGFNRRYCRPWWLSGRVDRKTIIPFPRTHPALVGIASAWRANFLFMLPDGARPELPKPKTIIFKPKAFRLEGSGCELTP